ncbi:MAG: hypothetical protein ACRDSJ_16380 [Rubrobacteraceae bacterium]
MSSTVGDLFGGSSRRMRDDVWGDIPVNRAVRALLETKAMERLKGMRQLGFASQAFPSARHSRFDHALGVYHLTQTTLKRITDSGAYLEDREMQGALAAALLLDVGRYPYSEALENIALPAMIGGKELSRRWVEQSEAAKVLRNEWDVEPHNVFRLITRDDEPPLGLTPTEHLIRDILFGSLDVDALDSLVRDARGAQVPFGLLKIDSLMEHLRLVGQENRALLSIDEDGAGVLQSLVFSRYLLRYTVYGHHDLRIPTAMFARAAQDAIQDERVSPDKLSEQDDAGAFVLIQDSGRKGDSIATLAKRLADRRPYFRALEIDERHKSYVSLMRLRDDSSWRRRVEEAWSRYLTRYRKGEAGPFDILMDIPKRERLSVGLRYIRRLPLPGERNLTDWQNLSGMTDEDMRRHNIPLHRIRVIAAGKDLVTSVRRHAEELLTIAEEVG